MIFKSLPLLRAMPFSLYRHCDFNCTVIVREALSLYRHCEPCLLDSEAICPNVPPSTDCFTLTLNAHTSFALTSPYIPSLRAMPFGWRSNLPKRTAINRLLHAHTQCPPFVRNDVSVLTVIAREARPKQSFHSYHTHQ